MFLAIDDRELIRQPHFIEVVTYPHDSVLTADQRPTVRPGSDYVQVNCTWGSDLTYEGVMREIHRLRANRGTHSITFEPMSGGRYLTINAYMGESSVSHVGYDRECRIIDSAITIPFIQVDTPTFLFPFRWVLRGTIAVLSPFRLNVMPVAGTIVGVEGYIGDLGAGAGQTRIQLANVERVVDYLSTPGDFINAPPPNRRLQDHVLGTDLDFYQGNQINCNVLTIPAGGLSRDAIITAWCRIHRP